MDIPMTKKLGRPTKYNDKISRLICTRIAEGESLKSICKSPDLPNRTTVLDWLRLFPSFNDRYRLSREAQVLGLADELLDIVRDHAEPPKAIADHRQDEAKANGLDMAE